MSGECYTYIRKPRVYEASNEIALKRMIESDKLDDCQRGLEELLQSLLAGEKFPTNLMMSVINRYQIMNRFSGDVGNRDKRIKRLLYILWECLPKRGPDGKFLDRMVMVCGAFDKDLKHANQYVCGPVARTLSKTSEPNVLRELVHSIEKCLEYSHAYQRKNAVLAIANLYKEMPDLNPSAPKLISEYLMKESDDECKRAALQALLEIDPEEARPYLHSSNVQDIHSMKVPMQLVFVKLIQRLYTKGSEEAEDYLSILTALIRLSTSPTVRCQAATTLMRFARDPEIIKQVATCFIDICAKGSDNNVKLDALENLTKLRRVNGAERVIRNSVMDIVFILQSASDVSLQGKILRLTLDLLSPLNVGDVVAALRQEIEKNAYDPERASYRRFLVGATYNIAERFPNAIVEYEMVDTLFDLLMNNPGDKISSDLILLFKMFITKNPSNQGKIIKKIQSSFNMIRNSPAIHRGLIQLLGEFSETEEQIEKSYLVIKESLGELPIVASEMRKRAPESDENLVGDDADKSTSTRTTNQSTTANGDVDAITKGVKRLVTADGSYATQSAISYQTTNKADEEHPPLRHYYLHNNFNTASVLCYALLKMACRFQQNVADEKKSEFGKLAARFMFLIASILNLGHSTLTDPEGRRLRINNDHSENLMLALTILQHLADKPHSDPDGKIAHLIKRIMVTDIRSQLKVAVKKVDDEGGFVGDAFRKRAKTTNFDDAISISFFASRDQDVDLDDDNDDEENSVSPMPNMLAEIPLTGTMDAIYACCEFEANQYDVELKIHLESREQATLENVTLELAPRGENASNIVDRPDPILLAPQATACITSNIKVLSAENRKLFGSISYENTTKANPEDREQVLMLNDINVNITDYIKPAKIGFDEFREIWRDCEWENKVTVKTKLTNLKEYLLQLVTATNMRCVTSEKSLDGDCSFLSANLYARSSFGEEALVNVSIEKVSPTSNVIGSVKIRSRSQGMALSLGEKITAAQSASAQDDLPKKAM